MLQKLAFSFSKQENSKKQKPQQVKNHIHTDENIFRVQFAYHIKINTSVFLQNPSEAGSLLETQCNWWGTGLVHAWARARTCSRTQAAGPRPPQPSRRGRWQMPG